MRLAEGQVRPFVPGRARHPELLKDHESPTRSARWKRCFNFDDRDALNSCGAKADR